AVAAADQPSRHDGADGHAQPRGGGPCPPPRHRHRQRPRGQGRGGGRLPARRNRDPVRQILASLWFALHSAGQNFRRNLGVSLAGVFTMGLIIFLVGGSLLFTPPGATGLQGREQNESHLKIYLSDNASLPAITNFESRLKLDPRVISVSFETKDQAARQASQNPSIQSALAVLGSNPLPASLNLNVRRLPHRAQLHAEPK